MPPKRKTDESSVRSTNFKRPKKRSLQYKETDEVCITHSIEGEGGVGSPDPRQTTYADIDHQREEEHGKEEQTSLSADPLPSMRSFASGRLNRLPMELIQLIIEKLSAKDSDNLALADNTLVAISNKVKELIEIDQDKARRLTPWAGQKWPPKTRTRKTKRSNEDAPRHLWRQLLIAKTLETVFGPYDTEFVNTHDCSTDNWWIFCGVPTEERPVRQLSPAWVSFATRRPCTEVQIFFGESSNASKASTETKCLTSIGKRTLYRAEGVRVKEVHDKILLNVAPAVARDLPLMIVAMGDEEELPAGALAAYTAALERGCKRKASDYEFSLQLVNGKLEKGWEY